MAEERANKVIVVLAAAVPLESVFLGKLIGMFDVAMVFIAFWGTIATQIGTFLPPEAVQAFSQIGPAVGFPIFLVLFFAYFTMAYMLRSEEHTSELQSLMRISYAVFCLKNKKQKNNKTKPDIEKNK